MQLNIVERLPEGFLHAEPHELLPLLGGPTLVHLPGERAEPLFVSVLLHGNETGGLRALQRVLAERQGRPLPRALSLFIGNVAAAKAGVRRLEGQPDYNRAWPGGAHAQSAECRMFEQVLAELRPRGVFASIDLHNNTGHNPYYACLMRLDDPCVQLAALFGPTMVYFRRPTGTQTGAFSALCPSVACECGRPDDEAGAERAAKFVDTVLGLERLPDAPLPPERVHLFHTLATVRVPASVSISFDGAPAALRFADNLEWFNFRELPAGTEFARCDASSDACLEVRDEFDRDVAAEYFRRDGEILHLARTATPAMLTHNERAVRQDCLCYFMERLPAPRTTVPKAR